MGYFVITLYLSPFLLETVVSSAFKGSVVVYNTYIFFPD